MRRVFVIISMFSLIAALGVMASDPGPWFDPVNCAFCKQFANEPGLLDHLHNEYHQLHNGMMQITHVDAEYEAAFAKAQVGVGTVLKDMKAGKQVTTCRHCAAQGALFQAGVMPDMVKRGDDYIIVFTSSDTTLIKQIQEFGKNGAEAVVVMEASKKPAAGTETNSK